MNTFNPKDHIITRALHWAANKFGGWKDERYNKVTRRCEPTDFCHWVRRAMLGSFWLICLVTLALLTIGMLTDFSHTKFNPFLSQFMPWWMVWVLSFLSIPASIAMTAGAMYVLARYVIIPLGVFVDKRNERKLEVQRKAYEEWRKAGGEGEYQPPLTGLALMTSALKQKYCVRIRVM